MGLLFSKSLHGARLSSKHSKLNPRLEQPVRICAHHFFLWRTPPALFEQEFSSLECTTEFSKGGRVYFGRENGSPSKKEWQSSVGWFSSNDSRRWILAGCLWASRHDRLPWFRLQSLEKIRPRSFLLMVPGGSTVDGEIDRWDKWKERM